MKFIVAEQFNLEKFLKELSMKVKIYWDFLGSA